MLKYLEAEVVFSEIPDEITLAINITNCQNHCIGCHSPQLRRDTGDELTFEGIENLISKNDGITCICFMGEGNDRDALQHLIIHIREIYGDKYKIGIYSGRNAVGLFYWENLDYIKMGPYIPEYGPLNKPTTNQRLFKRIKGTVGDKWEDITCKFWKRDE